MGLEDFLTAEDKLASLEALRVRTFSELYTACIRVGIDPDSFEYDSWTLPEHSSENNHIYQGLMTIARMCESLKIIDSKLV
jgi:hypothetical protein